MLGDFSYENDGEWAIVGGTGEFAYAHGAVTAKVIQPYTPAAGRIWELGIRAFCLCISEKVRLAFCHLLPARYSKLHFDHLFILYYILLFMIIR